MSVVPLVNLLVRWVRGCAVAPGTLAAGIAPGMNIGAAAEGEGGGAAIVPAASAEASAAAEGAAGDRRGTYRRE